jgi:CheY-like chemotaxis protein
MAEHRVLVVDDYPDSAETTCALLSMLGHNCRFAISGARALIEAAQFEPTIAILDIGLPDISGFELARQLREQFAGRSLFLAALTGWGQPGDRTRAFAAGFDHHLLKPASRDKLVQIVELAERRVRPATTSHRPGPG